MARKVYTKVLLDEINQEYIQQNALAKKFGVSYATIWRLLGKMEKNPKYKDSIIYLSHNLKLICIKDFIQFLKDMNGQWCKE